MMIIIIIALIIIIINIIIVENILKGIYWVLYKMIWQWNREQLHTHSVCMCN